MAEHPRLRWCPSCDRDAAVLVPWPLSHRAARFFRAALVVDDGGLVCAACRDRVLALIDELADADG